MTSKPTGTFSKIHFSSPLAFDIDYVSMNMRQKDMAEVSNVFWTDNPLAIAAAVIKTINQGNFAACCYRNDVPVALIGWREVHPGVLEGWSYATDAFSTISTSLTKFVIRVLRPSLEGSKVHRLQAISRFDHFEAHAWMRTIGMKPESTLKRYGVDGSDYIMFAATRDRQ